MGMTALSFQAIEIQGALMDRAFDGGEFEHECCGGRDILRQILHAPFRTDPDSSKRIVARIEAPSYLPPPTLRFKHR